MQTEATLLANNSQNCWMLHLVSVCTPCCMLLHKVWYQSNFSANNSKHFFCSVIAEAWRNNVGSVCTALPTLLGPHMLITHGLQRLMGCILPTMHCRSQHCWELFHPFAHHCQHTRNNSQHCWRNNVGSCCIRLHAALSLFSSISGLEKFFQFQTFPSCDLLTILLVALSSWSFPVTILINSSKRTKRAATTSLKQMDWRIMILADFVTNSGRNLWLSWHFWIKNNTFK